MRSVSSWSWMEGVPGALVGVTTLNAPAGWFPPFGVTRRHRTARAEAIRRCRVDQVLSNAGASAYPRVVQPRDHPRGVRATGWVEDARPSALGTLPAAIRDGESIGWPTPSGRRAALWRTILSPGWKSAWPEG